MPEEQIQHTHWFCVVFLVLLKYSVRILDYSCVVCAKFYFLYDGRYIDAIKMTAPQLKIMFTHKTYNLSALCIKQIKQEQLK